MSTKSLKARDARALRDQCHVPERRALGHNPARPEQAIGARTGRWTTSLPRVWLLAEGRDGDDAQIRTLAGALGWPCDVIEAQNGLGHVIVDRLCDAADLGREPRLPQQYRGFWPDVLIAAGGRSVSLARRIRRASGGRTRLVFVGRPWAALDQFDLIITTPQYRLPERPNILHNRLPLNRSEPERLAAAARQWLPALEHLPRPWLALLVGGDSGSFRMTPASADRLAARANAWVDDRRGSLLVATSRRTPPAAAGRLLQEVRDPAFRYRWRARDPHNPYLGFLALADAFLVTGDSASMLAEASATGRPVALFALEQRLLSKLLTSRPVAGATADPGQSRAALLWAQCRDKLTVRGYWLPARDLGYMHDVLRATGLLADGSEARAAKSAPPADDLEHAVARVRALLPEAAAAGSRIKMEGSNVLARAETGTSTTRCLDQKRLDAVDASAFRSRRPFPWLSAEGLLNDDAYDELRRSLPERQRFAAVFGGRRRYGQQSHDRYVLEYRRNLGLAAPWRTFIDELSGPVYRRFLQRLTGQNRFLLHFHWHYTPRGCSVSPHCDATWKVGSHIFYFNTEDDWEASWGGETLILDDHGRFRYDSAPAFEDFAEQHSSTSVGNASLLFLRTDHSWHGVRPLQCPEGVLRKVFIVEIRKDDMLQRVRTRIGI